VCWRARTVAVHIAGATVRATLEHGDAIEMRIGSATSRLAPGATLQVAA
jgi:hypothetical protein